MHVWRLGRRLKIPICVPLRTLPVREELSES
jgi:hypothetical protein